VSRADWVLFASWNTAALADGAYNLRTTATDDCGQSTAVTRAVTVDNTGPVAVITLPIQCTAANGVVQITGTASDANLDHWVLEYTGGADHVWHNPPIATGNVSVVNGVLGTWNTAGLPACAYTLRPASAGLRSGERQLR